MLIFANFYKFHIRIFEKISCIKRMYFNDEAVI